MKTILLVFLLLVFNTFGQKIVVNHRIYIDLQTLELSEYTTCDSTKTLRIMTDDVLSEIATKKLSKMYDLLTDEDDGVMHSGYDFGKKVAQDSVMNVLLINVSVSNSYKLSALEYISDILDNDDVLHREISYFRPTKLYVNYFQVVMNNNKREHVVVTLILPDESTKKYYYYNEE